MGNSNDTTGGAEILGDIGKRALSVVLGTAVTGLVGSVLGPGFLASCVVGLIGSYTFASSSGSSEAESPPLKVKGRGGAPSKKFGRPSGKGRDNNPPRNKRG